MGAEVIEAWARAVIAIMIAAMASALAIILWVIASAMLLMIAALVVDAIRVTFFQGD